MCPEPCAVGYLVTWYKKILPTSVKPIITKIMSHVSDGSRVYIKDKQTYAVKRRNFLGLTDSAVLLADDGSLLGYAGNQAKDDIVSVATGTDGFGVTTPIPTDFRTVGIEAMTAVGIDADTQIRMFSNFMKNYTKEQRDVYVAMYDSLDKQDATAVSQFVTTMVALLNN